MAIYLKIESDLIDYHGSEFTHVSTIPLADSSLREASKILDVFSKSDKSKQLEFLKQYDAYNLRPHAVKEVVRSVACVAVAPQLLSEDLIRFLEN